ncbi:MULTISPECIES: hypothetical protein [unclassified Pseudoalteromonas]|jgi:hypothetical protein|nr:MULTISPECIES: hypothetical protein [unclassified Pseudoalteromonas]KPW00537.1 hypothetical protein AN390_02900 [Pseudoalteromonas sp. P1-11]MDC9497375.1 hypothetical protein [Pseudoalteromonas sp. Angola-20]MDC9517394.1 hypothetical protein [Pseudoalteromonas sp. Angola-22]MDC9533886.1 hypothetical protein [Pseudoalteromonas sp. Angola-9]TMP80305.1 hypothetical protein CWB71_13620 [Pseudoalteromonas sp. S983]
MKSKYLDINEQTINELEEAWEYLNKHFYSELNLERDRPLVSEDPLGKLAYFMELGIYPPPELLLKISEIYEVYMLQAGKVDLEESFYGKPIKGIGNFSGREAKKQDVKFLEMTLSMEAISNEKKKRSQYEVAEEYLRAKGSDEDPEHLLRKLRRYRNKPAN